MRSGYPLPLGSRQCVATRDLTVAYMHAPGHRVHLPYVPVIHSGHTDSVPVTRRSASAMTAASSTRVERPSTTTG